MRMTGAEVLVNCLIEQDVDTVFGFPGGAVLFIYDALYEYQDKISHILTCDEQMRARGGRLADTREKDGVVIATSRDRSINFVSGIWLIYGLRAMVRITGNRHTGTFGKRQFSGTDMQRPPMRYQHNFFVKDVNDLADTVRQGIRNCKQADPVPF
jgi:acetolactate synthase-1/2/3 large subunit